MNPEISVSSSNCPPSCKSADFEQTLRFMARVPLPEGLTERLQAAVRNPPQAGRVLAWPRRRALESGWVRAAAAAAIVFVVAGGGWGVYSRVQPAGPEKGAIAPPRAVAPVGFSSAGAVRTPQTLNGPVLTHASVAAPQPVEKMSKTIASDGDHPAKAKSVKKLAPLASAQ